MSRWRFAAAIGLLAVSAEPPLAADDTREALLACAAETDDARRLRCYDATVAGLRGAAASRPATVTSAPAAATASTPAAALPPSATPATGTAAPAAAAAAAAATPTPSSALPATGASAAAAPTGAVASSAPSTTPSPEERFGKRRDREEEQKGQLSELSANVAALSAKPRGELVITLDNGQVWTEIAPGSKIRLEPGDPVTIEAGTLGSFILIAPNKRSSKVTRVR